MTRREIESKLKSIVTGRVWSTKEVLDAFGAEFIANGVYRSVYSIKGSDKYVLKIEHEKGRVDKPPNHMNIMEYMNYIEWFRGTCYEKWLAPCYVVTYDSRIMLQARVKPAAKKDMPAKLPSFFTDKKVANWGWYNGRIVCVDYSMIVPDQNKMKRAIWR
ncbi:MAG: hypothetical protein ACREHG_08210 [Candidatus Saccharimonadales bacterium]